MARDVDKVVFVGVPDLVSLTGVSKSYLSRIAKSAGQPQAKLPQPDALINAKPTWKLAHLLPILRSDGHALVEAVVQELTQERAMPSFFVPVGTTEGAEAIGLSVSAFRARHFKGTLIPPAFHIGSLALVWDLNALVDYARANGDAVSESAVEFWLARNGDGSLAPQRRAVATVRIALDVASFDSDVIAADLSRHLQDRLTRDLPALTSDGRLQIAGAEIKSIEIGDA